MKDILVYKAEADLADKIRANASVAYLTSLNEWSIDETNLRALSHLFGEKALASSFEDLYPTYSILASTVWNKNDDIFTKEFAWPARATPINKPTNLEHDEKAIVGHMTSSWVVDKDYKTIPDDSIITDIPDLFHICTGAVIYLAWQDKALKERTQALLKSIKDGEMFVSMECLFSGFDYGVLSPDNEYYTVARNDETAFLTKHLRAYGGEGVYQNHKVGRILKGITFSAKGYVKKPANPDSIIFSDNLPVSTSSIIKENPFKKNVGVSLSSSLIKAAENRFSDTETQTVSEQLTLQVTELKAQNAELVKANKELADKIAKADVEKYETKIQELEASLAAMKAEKEEEEKKKKEMEAKASELETKLEEANKSKASLQEELDRVNTEKTFANRVSTLVDGGIDKTVAEEKVKKFENLTDEQFSTVASDLIDAAKAKAKAANEKPEETVEETAASEEETDDAGETNAGNTSLENVDEEPATAGAVASETEEENKQETRLALAKLLASKTGMKVKE